METNSIEIHPLVWSQLHRWSCDVGTRESLKVRDVIRGLFERQHGIECLKCWRSHPCSSPAEARRSLELWLKLLGLSVEMPPEPTTTPKPAKRPRKGTKAAQAWQPQDLPL